MLCLNPMKMCAIAMCAIAIAQTMVWIHFQAQDYVNLYRRKLIWRTNFCCIFANLLLTDRVFVGCVFSFEQKFAI